MSYAFYYLCSVILLKILLKYKILEKYAAFIISITCIVILAERGIYLSPSEFKLSHACMGLAGFLDYYNVTMLMD